MCKHILNAQVAVRAPCCKKFFDCPQCHAETQDHPLRKTMEMAFLCKKVRLLPLYSHFIVSSIIQTRFFQLKLYPFQCKKAFRKDMTEYEEADEYCPHCDNQYVIEAKEPQAMIGVEGEDARIDNRMLKDDRVKEKPERSLFAAQDMSDKLDRMPLFQLNAKERR
ncbi:zinc finger protein [Cryptococcus neoformans]|nr:zinc finger protein [Cryptococcus neoformans var. grubii c45]OXB33881.1 zinc finger protein [Cryptococcus neoformans var. grubii]OXC58026.1 zinc finger protein [Cryptococcus neoformans var. grubii MW-RSA852]